MTSALIPTFTTGVPVRWESPAGRINQSGMIANLLLYAPTGSIHGGTAPTGAPGSSSNTGATGAIGATGPTGSINLTGQTYGNYIYWNTYANRFQVGNSEIT